MRLIDADKLRNGIVNLINDNVDVDTGKRCDNWAVDMCNECFVECLKLIDNQPTVNKWIPVSERLPYTITNEYGELIEYNVMIKGAIYPTTLNYIGEGEWREIGTSMHEGITTYEVIAWQPLPQQYE